MEPGSTLWVTIQAGTQAYTKWREPRRLDEVKDCGSVRHIKVSSLAFAVVVVKYRSICKSLYIFKDEKGRARVNVWPLDEI